MSIYPLFWLVIMAVITALLRPVFSSDDISISRKRMFTLIIILLFCVGGFGLYAQFGTPEILALLSQRDARVAELKEKITTNADLVKKDPENIKAWVELGDSFMETGQFDAAANAYKRAVVISQGRPEFIMQYIHALIIGADGTVTAEAKKSLDMMLILEPRNEEVRYFLAMYKMQSGDTKAAMEDMKTLYKTLPDDSRIKEMIDRQIGRK